ncbi:MAG: hypothetical protein WCF18_09125 [Chthoniobacteraceae bacterium]
MLSRLSLLAGLLAMGLAPMLRAQTAAGDCVIRAPFGDSEIVITATSRLAGAIHSLTWKGKEFIDSHDHGRQLQSASNLDLATPITNETFNPTEAGSERDGTGPRSSSRLLHSVVTENALQTTSQMAFWLAPGGKSGANPAKNTTVLSNHLLTKRVRIGYRDLSNVISYDVTFGLPVGERHTLAVFEALTGYMPPEFSRFLQFNLQSGELEPLDDTAGEIPRPIVFATPEGTHAMGIYAPPQKAPKITGPTFGRFRFTAEKVVKWNCVFRLRDGDGIAPGDYRFRMLVVIGDLANVTDSLRALHAGAAAP